MMRETVERTVLHPDGTVTRDTIDRDVAPLDDHATLVTLLAVKGIITLTEAADLTGQHPDRLTAEAHAWNPAHHAR